MPRHDHVGDTVGFEKLSRPIHSPYPELGKGITQGRNILTHGSLKPCYHYTHTRAFSALHHKAGVFTGAGQYADYMLLWV